MLWSLSPRDRSTEEAQYGPQEDRPYRCRTDRRHPRAAGQPKGARRRRALRHRRRRAEGQGAGPGAKRPGGRLRCQAGRHQQLRRDQGRRCGDRHRRHPAQAGHEPRRPSRDQHEGHGSGRRRHQEVRTGRLRHLHHQSARRHGLGAARSLRPAAQASRRHGRRTGLGALPSLHRRRTKRLSGRRHCLRARRARRHHGANGAPFDGGRHSAARAGQDGLARQEAARSDRHPHAQRRRRDRRPAQDRLRLLCPGRFGHCHGGVLS